MPFSKPFASRNGTGSNGVSKFDAKGPYEGTRGGTYWITESGDKTYTKPSPGAKSGDERTDKHRRKNQSLLSRVAEVPGNVLGKVKDFIASKYESLSNRYGATGAKLVLGGMIALMPVPVPGTSLLPIAIAEGVRGIKRLAVGHAEFAEMTADELAAQIKTAIAELYAANGEPVPDFGDVLSVAKEMLANGDGLESFEESDKWVSEKIRKLIAEGKSQDQAVAIALSMAGKSKYGEQLFDAFASGWTGPFTGKRGGTYWLSPTGKPSYDEPPEEKEAKREGNASSGAQSRSHPEIEKPKQIEGFSKTVSDVLIKESDELTKAFPFLANRFDGFEVSGGVPGAEFDAFTKKIRFPKIIGKEEDLSKLESLDRAGVVKGGAIDAGFRGTVIHEMGHAVDHAIKTDLPTDELRDQYHEAKQRLRAKVGNPSQYASKNLDEWVSERLLVERLGQAEPELSALLNEFGAKLKPVKKPRRAKQHSERFHSYANWQGPFEGPRGGRYWISPTGEHSYEGPQGNETPDARAEVSGLAKAAQDPKQIPRVANTISQRLPGLAKGIAGASGDREADSRLAGQVWNASASGVDSATSKEMAGRLDSIAKDTNGFSVGRKVRQLAGWLASLPINFFKGVFGAIKDFASSILRTGARAAGAVALHLGGIALGAGIIAAATLLPAVVPPAVALLAAFPIGYAAKKIITKAGTAAGNIVDPQQARFRAQGIQTTGLKDVNRNSELFDKFAAGWQGPFEGERGGKYWISPSGDKTYDPPSEEADKKPDDTAKPQDGAQAKPDTPDTGNKDDLWKHTGKTRTGGDRWQNQETGRVVYGARPKEPSIEEKAKQEANRQWVLARPPSTHVPTALKPDLDKITANLFGGHIPPEQVHQLFGNINGVTATVYPSTFTANGVEISRGIRTNLIHPDVNEWSRSIYFNKDGQLEVHNDLFMVKPRYQGSGLGAKAFSQQVEACANAGVDKITTLAGKGTYGTQKMNGYYTWARFGYDAPLESGFKSKLPPALKEAKTVQDLMATSEGRDYWKAKGYAAHMTFDLSPGSRSLQVLNDYRKAKGIPPLQIDEQKANAIRAARKAAVS